MSEETEDQDPQDTPEGEAPPEGEATPDAVEEQVEAWDSERALRKIRKANAEAKSLRERVKAAEAKAETVTSVEEELAAARAELAETKAAALREKVAHTYGLDPVLATRLRGESVEELQEDAQALLEVVKAGQRPAPRAPFVAHQNPQAVSDSDIDQMVTGLL